ncbi:MAG: hypothetical protein RSA29_00565 [Clostridium sp.]|uniref:hypothetical protein n=1 Tax=Clostridium sp. TaxID=1506 RepID=UPI00305EEA87
MSSRCNCGCGREYIENLLCEYKKIEEMSDEKFEQALKELHCAIENLEKGICLNEQGEEILEQINKWLQCYGCEYGLNVNSCRCKKIAEEMERLSCIIEKLQEESLCLAEKSYEKLCEAKKLGCKLEKLQCEYINCIKGCGC